MTCRTSRSCSEKREQRDWWPDGEPLGALWSSIPAPEWCTCLYRAGRTLFDEGALAELERTWSMRGATGGGDVPPGLGGWLLCVAYDFGRRLEPRAQVPSRSGHEGEVPDIVAVRCEGGIEYDSRVGTWRVACGREGRRLGGGCGERASEEFAVEGLESEWGREGFMSAAARVLEYIRAGDVYQVNLAHRLRGRFEGSPRALWRALCDASEPWHGAYIEADLPDGRRFALAGASPELFLHFDPATRRLTTRPMKGTRRLAPGSEEDLAGSTKDRAELAMIVDLMRNDLGRVCELGSVRVDVPRVIERHAGALLQTTATVSGVLRKGVGLREILRATFPPGSVTGAPKIRAMQIIDELEPVRRGAYCGCAGFLGDDGRLSLCVNIRSATIVGRVCGRGVRGTIDYSVGAGLVSESNPEREWEETLDKAAGLHGALSRRSAPPVVRGGGEPGQDDAWSVHAGLA